MKILIVSQYCWPEPDFRIFKVARELAVSGHLVQIVTTFPNYPLGNLYPGWKNQILKIENLDGVKIIRHKIYYSHDNSSLRRALTYFSFLVNGLLISSWYVNRPDVIFVYTPPITSGILGLFYKSIFRSKLVLDVQDLWPESIETSGMVRNNQNIYFIFAKYFSSIVYRKSDSLICITEGYKRHLKSKGLSDEKLTVIYNWANEEFKKSNKESGLTEKRLHDDTFTFLYAGNIGKGQDLGVFIEAVNQVRSNAQFRFVFIGEGTQKAALQERCRELNLVDRIIFLERKDQSIISSYVKHADVLFASLQDHFLSSLIMPSKIQSYMFEGKAILFAGNGEPVSLILKAECGLTSDRSPDLIARNIETFLSMDRVKLQEYGLNGFWYYSKYLSFEVGFAQLKYSLEKYQR